MGKCGQLHLLGDKSVVICICKVVKVCLSAFFRGESLVNCICKWAKMWSSAFVRWQKCGHLRLSGEKLVCLGIKVWSSLCTWSTSVVKVKLYSTIVRAMCTRRLLLLLVRHVSPSQAIQAPTQQSRATTSTDFPCVCYKLWGQEHLKHKTELVHSKTSTRFVAYVRVWERAHSIIGCPCW